MTALSVLYFIVARNRKRELESNYYENLNLYATIHLMNRKNDIEVFMYDEVLNIHYTFVDNSFTPSQVDLKYLESCIHPDDRERYLKEYESVISGDCEECISSLRIYNPKLDKYEYFSHVITPISKKDGRVTKFIYSRRRESAVSEIVMEKENVIETLKLALKSAKIFRWVNHCETNQLVIIDHEMKEASFTIDSSGGLFLSDQDVKSFNLFIEQLHNNEVDPIVIDLKLPNSDSFIPCQIIGLVKSDDTPFVFGIARDISDEYNYQNELKDKIELLETIKESIPVGVSIYDKDGLLVSSNRAVSNILGIDREKTLARSVPLFHTHEEYETALRFFEIDRSFDIKFTYQQIYEYISNYVLPDHPHGDYFDIKCTPIIGSESEIKGYVTVCIDNTEIMTDKQQIKELQDQITLALDASEVNILRYDIQEEFFTVLHGGNKLFENMSLADVGRFLSNEDFELLCNNISRLSNGLEDSLTTVVKVFSSGLVYWLRIALGVSSTLENRATLIGTYKDITNEMIRQEDLRVAKERAEESERLKIAFLANISHAIRTPLNAIIGFSELLHSTDDPQERAEYLSIVNSNNQLLLQFIDSILDMSRIESGELETNLETFDFKSAFFDTYLMFKSQYEDSDVELILDVSQGECVITLDRGMVFKIVDSFINNAFKFTRIGKIIMSYKYVDHGVFVSVEDTGIGIPEDKIHLLFKRFDKIDDFVQGAGLGLSISKAIAESMGGKVGVDSLEGKGSTFWVWIPCEASCG
ncbi:MAG: ATP-binding protein [Bacteroidales bacterium]